MSDAPSIDRRRKRHLDTAQEVVDVAVAVMVETGAAGMTLGEVARRMGIRTPSLYVYFPSKAALCDAIFARGWGEVGEVMNEYDGQPDAACEPHAFLTEVLSTFVGWALTHPAYSQLMFWRPIPNWEPSPEGYKPAVVMVDRVTETLRDLQRQGHIRADADIDEATGVWVVLASGLISQHLANEPNTPPDSGRFTVLIEPLVATFLAHYGKKSRKR